MALRIKRGMVLRTVGVVKVGNKKLPVGTRVKAMSKLENGGLRVKIKDPALPKAMQGEHVETTFAHVVRVPRGRPTVEAADEE